MASSESPPNPALAPSRIGYLPTLDGWRAIAILLVIFYHGRFSLGEAGGEDVRRVLASCPNLGAFGVAIFFGISGFLICSRLIDEERIRGRISLRAFYIRRCFRIFPALIALFLVMLPLSAAGVIHIPWRQWIVSVGFVANYFPRESAYFGHLWSLAVEEHFYLVFPSLLVIVGIGRGLPLSLCGAIGIAVWRAFAFRTSHNRPGEEAGLLLGYSHIAADGLFWGCVVAFLNASPPMRERLQRALQPAVWRPLCLALWASVALAPMFRDWKIQIALTSFQALVIPFVLVGTVLRSQGIAGRLLESSPMRWVGRLSYSLYLWQQIFTETEPTTSALLRSLQMFPWNIVMIFACATLSYYVIELPAMRIGHRIARPATAGREELVIRDPSPGPSA